MLPFKSTLFAAFFTHGLETVMHIQPVTRGLSRARTGRTRGFYGWWGDMDFGPHLLTVLAARRAGGGWRWCLHAPVPVDAFPDRKALAAYCERVIRASHPFAEA